MAANLKFQRKSANIYFIQITEISECFLVMMAPQVCNNSERMSAIIESCVLWDFLNQDHEIDINTHICKMQKGQKRS